MQKLDHGGGHVTALVDITKKVGSHKNEGRTEFFAFLTEQVLDDLIQEEYIRLDRILKKASKFRQVC